MVSPIPISSSPDHSSPTVRPSRLGRRGWRPLTMALAATVLTVTVTVNVLAGSAPPATAGPVPLQQPAPPPPPISFLVSKLRPPSPSPELAREVANIPVDSAAHRRARDQFDEASSRLADANQARDRANEALLAVARRDAELVALIDDAGGRVLGETLHLDQLRRAMHQLAVASYVTGQGSDSSLQSVMATNPDAVTEQGQQHTMVRSVRHRQVSDHQAAEQRLAAAKHQFTDRSSQRRAESEKDAELTAERDRQNGEQSHWSIMLMQRAQAVADTRALSRVVGTDFPLVVLDAYWKAAESQPECGVPWWALAGIGRTESGHGTDGGGKVAANGDTDKPIVGIALDGTNNTATIADTDRGLTDGDPFFDHAIGPMQFIPSTWVTWGRDGNGDARNDANNLYDASTAAAAYLCANGPMRTDADLVRGFLSYNHDLSYAALVLYRAKTYGVNVPLGTPPSSPPGPAPAPTPAPVAKGAAGATAPPPTTTPSLLSGSTTAPPVPTGDGAPDTTTSSLPAPPTTRSPSSTVPTSTPNSTSPLSTAPSTAAPSNTAPSSTTPSPPKGGGAAPG